jgi:Hemerythrin HHE cation binding domain
MITTEELSGFLSMHQGFRAEFGRLAIACRSPRGAAHEELLEEQLALVLDVLHLHHTHEDVHLWPFLLERSPESAPDLDALEEEHEVLAPLIDAAHDGSVPLPHRAGVLEELHRAVGEHLDHEERVGVPLMLVHMTPEMVRSDARKAESEIGRNRMPLVFGWLASCLDDTQLAIAVQQQPRLVRTLFRWFWWPSYERRFRQLYAGIDLGALAPREGVLR